MTKAIVHQSELDRDPNLLWNAFIDVVGGSDDELLSPVQTIARHAYVYFNQVMNGGHFQFFENYGLEYASETLDALTNLEFAKFADVLESAFGKAKARKWRTIKSAEDYVGDPDLGMFDPEDKKFCAMKPDLLEELQAYADRNRDEFFDIVRP